MIQRAVLLFAALFLTLAPRAQRPAVEPTKHPFLWKIVGDKPSYLYGTIHVPDPRIVALPDTVREAIAACDVLYTEIEFTQEVQLAMQKAALLPDGKSMQDVLPKETYARVTAYMKSKKVPDLMISGLAKAEPWSLLAVLPMLDDLRMLMSGDPLDARIAREAKKLGKQTAALEKPEEQLAVFQQFTHAEVAQLLDSTVKLMQKFDAEGRKPIRELIDVYLSGDLAGLEKTMDDMQGLDDLKELEARMEKSLLEDRNRVMVERLLAHRQKQPEQVHFFAVGAAHYFGETGILALLDKAGVKVERVGGEPPAYRRKPAEAAPTEPANTKAKQPVGAGK